MSDETKADDALDRAAIMSRARRPRPPLRLAVPEWEGEVFVARLSAGELDRYVEAVGKADGHGARAVILAHALVDAGGARYFDPGKPGDLADLAGFDAAGAERVVDAFREANGILRKN